MNVSKTRRMSIWVAWFVIIPVSFWFTYMAFPPQVTGKELDMIAFLILMCIVSCMPVVINQTPIVIMQGVSMAVFLVFGLVAELVLSQLAIMCMLVSLRVKGEYIYRYPLNSFMFFFISIISGIVYYLCGGTHKSQIENFSDFWPILAYILCYLFVNQVFLSAIGIFLRKSNGINFGKDAIWDAVTSGVGFPIGLVLFILYNELGLLSIMLVGIPIVSLTVILQLYYSSGKMNDALQKTSEIGKQIAERLTINEVIDTFIQKISEMLPVNYAYVYEVENDELQLFCSLENIEDQINNVKPLMPYKGITQLVWKTGKSYLFRSRQDFTTIEKTYVPHSVESIITVPIMRNHDISGVLVIASNQSRAFEKYHLTMVNILSSHLSVAIENAKHHEETKKKSEICALTKLYNYRYFEELLTEEFNKLKENTLTSLSLILLDIDHFKSVNDTYGHQSGNEILIQIADRLRELIGFDGTVARYGGEEFVILLPNCQKEDAYQLAETIRLIIANRPFILYSDLDETRSKVQVHITASIGVASSPFDAEDSMSLIRHADRAMYTGAKKAGRNKVAQYVK